MMIICILKYAFKFFPLFEPCVLFLCVFLVQGSAADGPRGLSVGDIVRGLEDCPVRRVEDWTNCLSHLYLTPQTGYCVPAASLQPSWAHGRRE